MGLLGHAHKKHRFQLAEAYPTLQGQWMLYRQDHDGFVAGDAFPFQGPPGCRGTQPPKNPNDLSPLPGAEMFPRGPISKGQSKVWGNLAGGPKRFRGALRG